MDASENMAWLKRELWFMRGSGIAFLVVALLAAIFGTFANPDEEIIISAMNIVLAMLMFAAGLWALWWSSKQERIANMLENSIAQGAGMSRILAVVQVIVGILFLLEGLSRGGIVMLLLGVLILVSAVFFFWRGQEIAKA